MSSKKKSDITLNFGNDLKKALNDIGIEVNEQLEDGITEAAEYMKKNLSEYAAANLNRTGELAKSFIVEKRKANLTRYVSNTKVNKAGIPVLGLLEFGSRGKPFVFKQYEKEKENLIKIIIGRLKGNE